MDEAIAALEAAARERLLREARTGGDQTLLRHLAELRREQADRAYVERVRKLSLTGGWIALALVVVVLVALLGVTVVLALAGNSRWPGPLLGATGLLALLGWIVRRMVRVSEPGSDLNRREPLHRRIAARRRDPDDADG